MAGHSSLPRRQCRQYKLEDDPLTECLPMKTLHFIALLAMFSYDAALHAELPPELKPTAENYDRAMKTYDANVAAMVKADRDAYLTVLAGTRKREVGAKRAEAVAAIDAEIKAVNAGWRSEESPAHLPADAARYRTRYITAPERAAQAVQSTRRHTRQEYLKWLSGMAAVARRGKSAELEAAVALEEKRVRAAVDDGTVEGENTVSVPDDRRKTCWKNVHRICVASSRHFAENSAYPNSIADLIASGGLEAVPISPYATDKEPASYKFTMPGSAFAFRDRGRTIIVLCTVAGPDGKVSAGFADGHVESIPADALSRNYSAARSTLRTWSNPTGKYSTEASFVEFVAGGVKLKRSDDKIITVAYSRLGRGDLDYLKSLNVHASE